MKMSLAKIEHLKSYTSFLFACYQSGLSKYEAAIKDPKQFLENIISSAAETSTYFCVVNEEIIGAIRFRHNTNEYIVSVIGHVGYETKPTARGKGVARFMLSWLQEHIMGSGAIITCEADNMASEKVIKHCGGVYLNQIYSTEKQNDVKRYELPIKK
ncbi:GNAT family N-acetyltransferase [Shewanella benthica]|nr:GNAT family N-acetyltransferase [Shewanella benthica]